MSRFPLSQFPLARKSPLLDDCGDKVIFTIELGTHGNNVSLVMKQQGAKKDEEHFIAIEKDTRVEIVLLGDQLFFSKNYDAITMKGPDLDFFYGQLEYGDYVKEHDRYRSVHFTARYNKGGRYDTTHGFNVNVDLLHWDDRKIPNW